MKTLQQYIEEKLVIIPSQVNEKLVINKNYKDTNTIEDFLSSEKLVYIRLSKLHWSSSPKLIIDIKKIKHINDYNIDDTEITMSCGDGLLYADEFNNITFSIQKNNLSLLRYYHSVRRNNWVSSITLLINPSVNDKVKSMIKIIYNNGSNENKCKDALIDFIKYVVEDDKDQNTIIDFIGEKINTGDVKNNYSYSRLMSELK